MLAFDRMHPSAPVIAFTSETQQFEVGRSATTALDAEVGRLGILDPSISTVHFSVMHERGRWVLTDRASKNGTYVNGIRATEQTLREGDVIEAGAHYLVVTRAHASAVRARMIAPQTSRGLDSLVPGLVDELARIERLATSTVPIHITGETGTGKEVLAQEIHRCSGRPGKFVGVNCGAIPESLIASELFGAKRGAYSGAGADRDGLIRASDRGTLFLDEVAELSLASQAALLRVLQEREVVPVGATTPERCDLRVVSATNKDLHACCDAGSFRRDLLARLCGADVQLPALRHRRQDLGLLSGRLLCRAGASHHTFSRGAARALFLYSWPHNIRELQRALELAIAAADRGAQITEEHLPPEIRNHVAESMKADSVRFCELAARYAGNVTSLARALGTSRSHVRRLALRHGCDLDRLRGGQDRQRAAALAT